MNDWEIFHGDALEELCALGNECVDAVVTDPPYELGFMGKGWDRRGVSFRAETWEAVFRVMKPGAHLLAFGGTRTYHRLVCAIEDAGFEIRDSIHWIYGTGFPKSLNVGKAIDKAAGMDREVVGVLDRLDQRNKPTHRHGYSGPMRPQIEALDITAPATDAAKQWDGWGTALKPAHEPIVVARKPFKGTVAANVEAHGTGGINVNGCRVGSSKRVPGGLSNNPRGSTNPDAWGYSKQTGDEGGHDPNIGRWPPNVLLDPSAAEEMDRQSGKVSGSSFRCSGVRKDRDNPVFGKPNTTRHAPDAYGDPGGASRFFPIFRYEAKASRAERDAGLEGFDKKPCGMMEDDNYPIKTGSGNLRSTKGRNTHPTVKPLALMQWLVRLVTPPGGLILDPFLGSGTTGIAALREGFRFVGIEQDQEHVNTATQRIVHDATLFNQEGRL